MVKVIFICGLMGCGKTTFAKQLSEELGYEYVNFDEEYHTNIQNKLGDWSNKNTLLFLQNIAALLNNSPSKNFIIDNWFKWHVNWWRDEKDTSLQIMKTFLKHHEIQVICMVSSYKETYRRYIAKHERDVKRLLGGAQPGYRSSMRERQENLMRKVSQWATQ